MLNRRTYGLWTSHSRAIDGVVNGCGGGIIRVGDCRFFLKDFFDRLTFHFVHRLQVIALGIVVAASDDEQQGKQHSKVQYQFVALVPFMGDGLGEGCLVFGESVCYAACDILIIYIESICDIRNGS